MRVLKKRGWSLTEPLERFSIEKRKLRAALRLRDWERRWSMRKKEWGLWEKPTVGSQSKKRRAWEGGLMRRRVCRTVVVERERADSGGWSDESEEGSNWSEELMARARDVASFDLVLLKKRGTTLGGNGE